MSYLTFGYRLPAFFSIPLFGDRQKWGLCIQPEDPDWKELSKVYADVYYKHKNYWIEKKITQTSYSLMSHISLEDKKVLEIGAAEISHIPYWDTFPQSYTIADVNQEFLELAKTKLQANRVNVKVIPLKQNTLWEFPFENEFDLVVSFHTFEHLHPLRQYLEEILQVLKPGGLLIGAVPCEGGLAWGCGRYLTSRRWIKKHKINPDKVYCWEHPNFVNTILQNLDALFCKKYLDFWPSRIPYPDVNIIAKFIYQKAINH